MRPILTVLIGALLFQWSGSAIAITPCRDLIRSRIVGNDFKTDRGLNLYIRDVGRKFRSDLEELKASDTFLDLGCGDGVAGTEYRESYRNGASYVGITYKADEQRPSSGRFTLLKGRFFEEIPDGLIPRAKLISDVYGVFAYSPQIDLVLQKSLNRLMDNGAIYILLGHFAELDLTLVRTSSGEVVKFSEWLARIPGIQVEYIRTDNLALYEVVQKHPSYPQAFKNAFLKTTPSLRITITDRRKIKIPSLLLLKSEDYLHSPIPVRFFKESGNSL